MITERTEDTHLEQPQGTRSLGLENPHTDRLLFETLLLDYTQYKTRQISVLTDNLSEHK